MEKSWMHGTKWSKSYVDGVNCFMQFVRTHMGQDCDVRCPCKNCLNLSFKDQKTVKRHVLENGMDPGYVTWFYHGEPRLNTEDIGAHGDSIEENNEEDDGEEDDGVGEMLFDLGEEYAQQSDNTPTDASGLPAYLETLMRDTQTELYPGCKKISRISFIIKLLHLKVYNKLGNRAVDMMLGLMKSAFPDGETLPSSCYEAKKYLRDLGLGYECIHACKYDCVLFWNENKNLEACPTCGTSRWKINHTGKKIPHKILRYFPVTPRLRRLYTSSKTSKKMVWHKEKRIDDDYMRHPADSIAWKDFDSKYQWFADDPRNVRLALAADGFNPFGNMSSTYSMWPVILAPLNLPPWDCMKQSFLMLSLLIPGKKSPGKDIDVYLQPLVKELTELWVEGSETFDVSSKQKFQMHAAILWTINDFPAYGDLSGWVTKGYMACPQCNEQTCSQRLRNKLCYMGHRRYLPKDHAWRKSKKFNGKADYREPSKELSGDDVLLQLERLQEQTSGKYCNKKRKRMPEELNWSKRSIFFYLPYWSKLRLRHNLDVMHIEKNICESILGTLMSIDGKTKDTIKARQDLEDMKIRKELHLIKRSNGKYFMPAACYVFNKKERHDFCEFLKSIKFPDGYASNISRCVGSNDQKISGLKSHDCHILLQRILPVGVRGSLNKNVSDVLAELGHFFQRLCCKKLKRSELPKMGEDISLILCKLEQIYPPAFFDIMIHLATHLPKEALLGGPVQFRWMYPIERSLCVLKQSVRNKAHPEGSIAEAYIANECLTFCSMYLQGIETRFNREERNNDVGSDDSLLIFSQKCRHFGATKYVPLLEDEFEEIQWFVYQNCEEIEPYIERHKQELLLEGCSNINQYHKERFPGWLKILMTQLYNAEDEPSNVIESLYSLACAPNKCVRKYTGCIVNGVRFLTKERDSNRKSQNSGIVVEGNHGDDKIEFFGILTDIIKLDYVKDRHITIFKCEWFDLGTKKRVGIRKEGNITSINVTGKWYENDPYIFADQANQVFYINDPKLGVNWRLVQPFKHRHIYDVDEMQDEQNVDGMQDELDAGEILVEEEVYQENHIDGAFEVGLSDIQLLHRDDLDLEDNEHTVVSGSNEFHDEVNVENFDEDELDDTLDEYCSSEEDSGKNSVSDDYSDDYD